MWLRLSIILYMLASIGGCASNGPPAPVKDRKSPSSTKVLTHTVAPGETLYAIAWRYNLDYKTLAKANGIGRSYTIYPGQKIYLKGAKKRPYKPSASKPKTPATKTTTNKTHTQVAKKNPPKRLKNTSKVAEKNTGKKKASSKITWGWPANGKILTRFQSNSGLNKGIDIGGKLREPVYAAASGTVVYSGEGLRGYGKLVIIKHSEKYLSAYAHNHRLLVKEGDVVKLSEKIAEMGETGTNSTKLHFEIRFDGKPVNPLIHLPPR